MSHSCCCCCDSCRRGGGTSQTLGGSGSTVGTGKRTGLGPSGVGGKGRSRVGSWLLIRFDAVDRGARPVPSGDVFWESPDIWLTGGDTFGNPIGGQPATVFARVWNLGVIDAAPVSVDFLFISPSLGIPPSAPELIGTSWGVIRAQSAHLFSCPWTPPEETQATHACLIANCSAPLQGDVPTAAGDPVSDRHTGQHNLTILDGKEGQLFEGAFLVTNLAPLAATVQLMAAGAWLTSRDLQPGSLLFPPSLAAAVGALDRPIPPADMRSWARRAATIANLEPARHLRTLSTDAIVSAVRVTSAGGYRRISSVPVVPRSDRVAVSSSAFTKVGDPMSLEALQQTTVNVSITVPPSHGHAWFLAHLAQATGGVLAGGYTVAVRLTL